MIGVVSYIGDNVMIKQILYPSKMYKYT